MRDIRININVIIISEILKKNSRKPIAYFHTEHLSCFTEYVEMEKYRGKSS
jgi:hypothetical protein